MLPTALESPISELIVLVYNPHKFIHSNPLQVVHCNSLKQYFPALNHPIMLLSGSIGTTQYFQRVLTLVP